MTSSTSAGTMIAMTSAVPTSQDAAGYGALAFTTIGGVESIPAFGAQVAVNSYQPLAGPQEKHKGPVNYGSLQIPMALDKADVGQILLRIAAAPSNNATYAFQVTFPNGDKRYFQGRVFGAQETPGSATNVLMLTSTIEINTVVVKADAGAPVLGTLTLSGTLQIGTATSGTIIGATVGSTIASNIPGITVNSGARTYSGTPTGFAQTITNGLVETLAGATGSPKPNSVTVAAAGGGAYVFSNTEAADYVGRMSAEPDNAYKSAIDTAIGSLKTAGVWAKRDVYYFPAPTQQGHFLNAKSATFGITVGAGSPVFVPNRGTFVNGLTDYLDMGIAPSGGTLFAQNDASVGLWARTPAGVGRTAGIFGTLVANVVSLNPRTTSNLIGARLNSVTADTSVSSANYNGWTAINRPSATQIQSSKNGTRGSLVTSNSASRSSSNLVFGKAAGGFSEGQFVALALGGALSDAEDLAEYNAMASLMASLGITDLQPAARTLSSTGTTTLPDGSAPFSAGKGMGTCGLARRSDGKWFVGNGLATATSQLVTRLDATFTTVEAEYTVSSLGLASPPGNGSVQGICFDASDGNKLWCVHKIGNSGATTYLYAIDTVAGTLAAGPFALPTLSCNGVADDGVTGTLLITQDISPSIGGMIRVNKADGTNTGTRALQTPGDTDQLHYIASATDSDFMTGDLLVSSGPNVSGGNGRVDVMRKDDYGAYCARRVDTLTGADAIEGIVLNGSTYYVANDSATHTGAVPTNRVITYAA